MSQPLTAGTDLCHMSLLSLSLEYDNVEGLNGFLAHTEHSVVGELSPTSSLCQSTSPPSCPQVSSLMLAASWPRPSRQLQTDSVSLSDLHTPRQKQYWLSLDTASKSLFGMDQVRGQCTLPPQPGGDIPASPAAHQDGGQSDCV